MAQAPLDSTLAMDGDPLCRYRDVIHATVTPQVRRCDLVLHESPLVYLEIDRGITYEDAYIRQRTIERLEVAADRLSVVSQ